MESQRIHLLLNPRGWMSEQVFNKHMNPEEVISNASEEMDLLERWE